MIGLASLDGLARLAYLTGGWFNFSESLTGMTELLSQACLIGLKDRLMVNLEVVKQIL